MADDTLYGWNDSMNMSLLTKMKADLKQAMLSKDNDAKSAIRQVMSEFPKLTIPITLESGKKSSRPKKTEEITDDEVLGIIQGLVKSEKIVLEHSKADSSPYLEMLSSYLPNMAQRQEIGDWIKANIDFSQFKNAMQAMGPIMKHFGKRADGTLVKELLQEMAG